MALYIAKLIVYEEGQPDPPMVAVECLIAWDRSHANWNAGSPDVPASMKAWGSSIIQAALGHFAKRLR